MIHTVSLAQVTPQPWRNGGGVTQELLAWPAAEDWQVRISVARIDRNGPFSAYPGIERWFTVLQGEGVVLRFANRRAMLSAGSEPIRFEGASAPGCELLDGPTEDLNLMLRSSAGRGGMAVVRAGDSWQVNATVRALFTLDELTLHVDDLPPLTLAAGTLAHSDQAAQQRWRVTAGVARPRAWWLHFNPFTP
ncbi:MAG: HutD family protein [Rubrivivax sp.]|nr:HutD family protein [Rubrivivax sp.]